MRSFLSHKFASSPPESQRPASSLNFSLNTGTTRSFTRPRSSLRSSLDHWNSTRYTLMTDTLLREIVVPETQTKVRPPHRSSTRAVRAGIATDLHHGAVVPPIHLTSTFAFGGFGKKRLYDYTRTGNPTREYLANALAELEGGEGGIVTSTGMSAVALVLQLVNPGDLVLAAHDCYGGTHPALRFLPARGPFHV